ncbi:phage holin family protein [Arthrobacter antioxidans]|uniref:phage holin family protein n=1 Tax=Arthrobacter antioxidans TaxID=2895818 RepID=UPI001FFF013E|nr:phage holin family protein [Arthrobacter antioxidans]
MIRFLIHILINLATAAIGLLLAGWIVSGVVLQPTGFVVAVIVFALAQGVLGPFVFNVARQYASAILGGIGLVTTLIALVIASWFDGGLEISGFMAWVGATLLVWIVTALGGWILGWLFITRRLGKGKESKVAQ